MTRRPSPILPIDKEPVVSSSGQSPLTRLLEPFALSVSRKAGERIRTADIHVGNVTLYH